MILLLDNYDSFVHNLARYLRRLGLETQVIRSDQIDAKACQSLQPDGIVISPGPKWPADAGCSIDAIRESDPHTPILGVCLGHQAIGFAFGGQVHRCGPMHGMASPITHDSSGLFADLPSPMTVARYHSLAIDPNHVPDSLIVTATTDDGIIMGVRHRTRPVFGVQFHPESVLTDDGLDLLGNFANVVKSANQELTQ